MSSNSETGHAVNIANYKLMGTITAGFDAAVWNPTNKDLLPAAITAKAQDAENSNAALHNKKAATKQPVNERQILFGPLPKTITASLSYLNSTKASKQVQKDAKTLADDLRGENRPAKPKKEDTSGDKELDGISQSHQSYVQRVDRFTQYIELIKTITDYTTTDASISVTGMENYLNDLQVANDGIGAIINAAKLALINRNHELYLPDAGIFSLQKKVKEFAKSKFGARDPNNRLLSGLRFTDIRKTK